jgi:hypothetical protein
MTITPSVAQRSMVAITPNIAPEGGDYDSHLHQATLPRCAYRPLRTLTNRVRTTDSFL